MRSRGCENAEPAGVFEFRQHMGGCGLVGQMRFAMSFFFSSRRRHTRFKCDWSSDVCSSDLTFNLFEAARRARVKRIIMATSNHAVGFYPRDRKIDHRVVPRPDSRYGVSKAFAEALASLYADKHGIGFLCIRIGNFGSKPIDKRRLSIWISPRDLTQLVRIGLEHPAIRYEIVYGVSINQRSWYDNSNAERLGYRPQDDCEPYAEAVLAAEAGQPSDPIAEQYQGGTVCAA